MSAHQKHVLKRTVSLGYIAEIQGSQKIDTTGAQLRSHKCQVPGLCSYLKRGRAAVQDDMLSFDVRS